MNNQTLDPIEQALSGSTLFSQTDISQAQIIHANQDVISSLKPSTLNELLGGHAQQAEILARVLEKQNEVAQKNTSVSDDQNELS